MSGKLKWVLGALVVAVIIWFVMQNRAMASADADTDSGGPTGRA